MLRAALPAGLLMAAALAAQMVSLAAIRAGTSSAEGHEPAGFAALQDCRAMATVATTKSRSPGFSADTRTTCSYDKTTNQSTCTNTYTDSLGTSTTTVSVTTFASLADAIDEITVIPPRRRSLRTDTTATGQRGSAASSLVNTYDKQNRLIQEVGDSPNGTFTTTYTVWDEVGRPTAGKTVTRANINSLTLAYDNRARTVTTTTDAGGQQLVCVLTFDANGNPTASSCKAPGGVTNSSSTVTTATEKVCR